MYHITYPVDEYMILLTQLLNTSLNQSINDFCPVEQVGVGQDTDGNDPEEHEVVSPDIPEPTRFYLKECMN